MGDDYDDFEFMVKKLIELDDVLKALKKIDSNKHFCTHYDYWNLKKDCYLSLGNRGRAKFYHSKAIKAEIEELLEYNDTMNYGILDHLYNLYYNLGIINNDASYFLESCRVSEKIFLIEPDLTSNLINWSVALFEIGRMEHDKNKLIESCQKCALAISYNPNSAEAYTNWGYSLGLLGKLNQDIQELEEACAKYEKALRIEPRDVNILNGYGVVLHILFKVTNNKVNLENAYNKYLKAVEIDSGNDLIYYNLAKCLESMA